jgi:hypothetical protein
MMRKAGTGRRRWAALAGILAVPAGLVEARAQTFAVAPGVVDTTPKTLSGTQTGTVAADGVLRSTTSTATINWNNTSTGVVITNSGLIENTSTGRAIDSSGNGSTLTPRTLTFLNNVGAILRTSQADAFRINSAVTSGTITIDNAGLIQAGGTGYAGLGQALDFRAITAASGVTLSIVNRATGIIEALTDDAVRPGRNATIDNAGIIRSFGANTSGGANGTADGIDAGGNIGVVVTNRAGGLISGARHGITADTDITVTNLAGGTIIGRNGSGIGSDGAGTVTNWGRITGAYAGAGNIFNSDGTASVNGDGDGVDIDNAATIVNHGIIEGTGAGGFDSGGRANNSEGISIGGGSITNDGTISGASYGIVVNKDSNADRSGVAATSIVNEAGGLIVGQNGFAIRLENKTGTAIDNDTIVNRGTIIGNGSIPDPNGVVTLGSGAVDTNSTGTLNGVTYTGTGSARFIRGDGSAIQMGEGSDTLTNYGTIIGNTGRAVNLEGGNDTMNAMAGSRITGLVDGGAGSDILNYNKIGLTEAKRAALQAGQTVNIGGTLYTSFETVNGTAQSFGSFATSGATRGIAAILDNGSSTVGASTATVALIDQVASAADVNAALQQLSPSSYQGLARFTTASAQQTLGLVGQFMTDARLNGSTVDLGGASAAMAMFDEGLFSRRGAFDRPFGGNPDAGDPFAAFNGTPAIAALGYARSPAGAAAAPDPNRGLFVNSSLTFARQGARINAPETQSMTANVVLGTDWRLSEAWRAGVFGGFARTTGTLDGQGSRTGISTGTLGAFATHDAGSWFATGMALYGLSGYDNSRVALGTVNTSSFTGNHVGLRGSLGTDRRIGAVVLTPEIALQYVRVHVPGFAETGAAALAVAADNQDSLRSSLGLRIARDVIIASGTVTPELRLAWQHEFLDGVRNLTASLLDASFAGSFTTSTAAGSRDTGVFGAGISGRLGPLTTVSLNYDAFVGTEDATAHRVSGRLRHAF